VLSATARPASEVIAAFAGCTYSEREAGLDGTGPSGEPFEGGISGSGSGSLKLLSREAALSADRAARVPTGGLPISTSARRPATSVRFVL
jgi:hypothetical protein